MMTDTGDHIIKDVKAELLSYKLRFFHSSNYVTMKNLGPTELIVKL